MTMITLAHTAFAIRIVSFVRLLVESVGWLVGRLLTHPLSLYLSLMFFLRFIFVCLPDGITDAFNPHMYIASK